MTPDAESQRGEGPVDHCDKCGDALAYTGNNVRAFGLTTVCDGCYDRIMSVI